MLNATIFADNYQPKFGTPWQPLYTRAQLAAMENDDIIRYRDARLRLNEAAVANPVEFGWKLPMWDEVMANWKKYRTHIICGGNRATKSALAARLTAWAGCTIPQAEIHAYQVNKEKSIAEQQLYVWEALPNNLKSLPTKKGQYHSIQYNQKNGFTDDIVIFPPHSGARRGGYIRFHNYAQYADDPNTAESFKAHLIWLDEECPVSLFKTAQYRTLDYHGRIVLTFTTILGWSPLIQSVMAKTRTLKRRFAPMLNREIPIIQESLSWPDTVIYYFWTEDNVFIDTADAVRAIRNKPKDEIMARAYGIPTKSIANVFPLFERDINVVKHEDLPFIKAPAGSEKPYKVTRYMAIDPAGRKNWFMVWVAIDAAGTWWVYREWPDYDDWALPGNTVEGRAGPAQKGTGKGIKDYVDLIKHCEDDEEIYERFIDPRMGAAEKQAEEGAVTIISQLDDQGMTVIPAPGGAGAMLGEIDDGIQLINDLLQYNQEKPRDAVNAPHLFVSDRCPNVIYALQEYTGKGGQNENTKDPIDCLRFLRRSNCEFYETQQDYDSPPTGVY